MNTKIIKKTKIKSKNDLAVPRLEKIVINVGVGRMSQQSNFTEKILPEIIKDFATITGQKPALTSAKKSIAGFKTREGQVVGMKATLRRQRMKDFLERLVKITLPRVKDFKGIELKNIDSNGNLTIGMKENVVFPEINPEFLKFDFGLEISIVSNAKTKEEAIKLYRLLGIPLKKD
ncbi:50S ribosomal protein L5 [Candidatus Wolfebacteria bacterium CG02_land_8_20_14_3_00_37_12]|uniref:Large ribosomal subunit protein uL5 n=3 Tax=Candidatus Wolfeibacteriota TaxID=1752735 RepID=A0A2M7Q8B0_9BACT|nr:MAG: 50S ribosomal protein L5 [Candidatus Wolfebacteria bacterium CG02_land_8_20_14_3_00_37_12]PIY59342.1 MAG: 50S ribosomal protein L5 [Candidatus Wolfebacteria bacterium CG_4_10_14_0_8_um_filter_37_11]PJA41874.1 MAG: 50S ribosomal protein L5 [Candidatus Wolfebacteria bacterium CG_4_9_14_3_um_filter_37_9]